MGKATLFVERPRKDPPKLRRLADARGLRPAVFLWDVIGRHATYEDAARECGVSRQTLWAWCRRYTKGESNGTGA